MDEKGIPNERELTDIGGYVKTHGDELAESRRHTWWYNTSKKAKFGAIVLLLGVLGGGACMGRRLYPSIRDWQNKYDIAEGQRKTIESQLVSTKEKYNVIKGKKDKTDQELVAKGKELKHLQGMVKQYKLSMSFEDLALCNKEKRGGVVFRRNPLMFQTFSGKASQRYPDRGLTEEDNTIGCYQRTAFGKQLQELLGEKIWTQKDVVGYSNNTLNVSSENSLLHRVYNGKTHRWIEYAPSQEKKLVDFLKGE